MMQFTLMRERTSVRLGPELGRGGEGTVFAVEGQQDRVAKIYSSALDPSKSLRKASKLVVMAELAKANPLLLKVAAWPIDVLIDSKGVRRGFIMPRVNARGAIHELYNPKSRAETFPEVNFRFLVHVAANVARAFAVVHEQGHVVGDVNHGNLLVRKDGTVELIDCDSFQIGNRPNVYTCDVGVPLFTAPELQGHAFRGLVRTANHDRFGLAVLLFHLLYMGRHPFAGRYLVSDDMPIEKAIGEYRFAYGPDRAVNGMESPPSTVPLEAMGEVVAQLFIRAFGRAGSNSERPDARTWVEALEKLEASLRVCSRASWHHYLGGLATCPWCTVESQTGACLFGQGIVADGTAGAIDLDTLWGAISTISGPGPDPVLPCERSWHPPPGVEVPSGSLNIFRKVFRAILPTEKQAAADKAYSAARTEWEEALARWNHETSRPRDAFARKLEVLTKAHAEMTDLLNEQHRRLAEPEAKREMRQLQRYLNRFRISRANIPGIGGGRSAMLASYGIETAADISRQQILKIPGFGEVLTSELLQWRQGHARNFRFNPSDPDDRRARMQDLLSALRQGPDELQRLRQEINVARKRLMPTLEKAWETLKIAEARRNAL